MVVQTEWGCEIEVSRRGCSAVVEAECRLQRLKRSADAEGDRRCGIDGIVVVTTCEAVLQDAMHSGARRQQTRVRPWLQFATSHAPSPATLLVLLFSSAVRTPVTAPIQRNLEYWSRDLPCKGGP